MASRTCRSSHTSMVPLRSLSNARNASRQPALRCVSRSLALMLTRRVGGVPSSRDGRGLSLGAEQAGPVWHMAAPFLTRDGGGELKTLEPCHRSRPGTAPSHRRRSPFASDAAAGPMGSAARLRASSRGARTLAFSASGIACGPQTLPGGPESIRENSPSTSLRLVRDNSSQDKSVSRAARGRLALARTTRSCSDPAAGAHGKRAHKQRPHSLCTHCTSPSAVRRASDADAKEASEPC